MMKSFAFLPLFAVLLSAPLFGQAPTENTPDQNGQTDPKGAETEGPRRFWQATLPGGHFMVALDHITSISRQTYLLDGALVVHEINVDTTGQALARFYFIEPPSTPSTAANRVIDRSKELLDEFGKRTTVDPQNMVTKKYPETTHAKCIEYRLLDVKELDSLYKSLKDAWETGKGRKFAIK